MCRVQSEVLPCVSVRFWGFSMMIDVQQQTAAHRVETRESQSASRKNTALCPGRAALPLGTGVWAHLNRTVAELAHMPRVFSHR